MRCKIASLAIIVISATGSLMPPPLLSAPAKKGVSATAKKAPPAIEYMPPVAPQLDNGAVAPNPAPDLHSGQNANGGRQSLWTEDGMPAPAPELRNPLAVNSATVLRGRATEYGVFSNPLNPYAANAGAAQFNTGAAQFTARQDVAQTAPSTVPVAQNRSAAGQAARAGLNTVFAASRFVPGGNVLGALHCPLCRLLGGF